MFDNLFATVHLTSLLYNRIFLQMVIEGTSSIPSQSLSSNNIEAASTKESPESTKTSEGGTDTSGPSQSKSAKQDDENSRYFCVKLFFFVIYFCWLRTGHLNRKSARVI